MPHSLHRQVAFITGANTRIGLAIAKTFARSGALVALFDRESPGETADKLIAQGGRALAFTGDVANELHITEAVAKTVRQWGKIEVVVANGGNDSCTSAETLTLAEREALMTIQLRGTLLTVKAALPHLEKQGGSVVVMSCLHNPQSVDPVDDSGAPVPTCANGAQTAYVKMLALEVTPHHIRVNALCPGTLQPEGSVPQLRLSAPIGAVALEEVSTTTPEAIAEMALFLASDASRQITGTEVFMDGSQLLPPEPAAK